MSFTPLLSITIPAFNAAATLPWAIASLLCQTYPHWGCVVVDDGSTGGRQGWASGLTGPRVRCCRWRRSRGRGFARETALEAARGEWLCMRDADDWCYPDKLVRQVSILERRRDLVLV